MSNENFDLEHWCRHFPAADIERLHQESSEKDIADKHNCWFVGGPQSIAMNTHCRKALWPDLDPAGGVPTDVFTWALGESENRAATKIGGMPYLPRSMAWPITDEGAPLEFLAQLNLSDLEDQLPTLPGNMLLIFCEAYDYRLLSVRLKRKRGKTVPDPPETDEPIEYILSDDFTFIFVDMNAYGPESLLERDEAPAAPFYLRPLHGQRIRTTDHPDLNGAHVARMAAEDPKRYQVMPPGCWRATKVGGVPTWEQEQSFAPWGKDLDGPDAPKFLGQLSSDRSNLGKPFPYVGREEPYANPWDERLCILTIADVGMLYLFWDGEKVLYEVQGG